MPRRERIRTERCLLLPSRTKGGEGMSDREKECQMPMRMRPAHAGAVAHSQNLNVGVDSVEGDGKRQMGVKSLGALF